VHSTAQCIARRRERWNGGREGSLHPRIHSRRRSRPPIPRCYSRAICYDAFMRTTLAALTHLWMEAGTA
jgi:hypothetical protein